MYEYSNLLGSDYSQADIDRHSGTRQDFVARHTVKAMGAALAGKKAVLELEFVPRLVKRIADDRNLRMAWEYCERHGGSRAAANGRKRRVGQQSVRERRAELADVVANLKGMRDLRQALLAANNNLICSNDGGNDDDRLR